MRQIIYDALNRVIGYIVETNSQSMVYNSGSQLIGWYNKIDNRTYKHGRLFGYGDQSRRLLS